MRGFHGVLMFACACSSGPGGSMTATFDTGGGQSQLDEGCELKEQGATFWDIHAIDSGADLGIELAWDRVAITAPGTYSGGPAAGLFATVLYPDPADPSQPALLVADGSVTFVDYDPEGGMVTGSLAWTVDDPVLAIAATFDCRD
jgi:hypothetical protein